MAYISVIKVDVIHHIVIKLILIARKKKETFLV